MKVIGRFEIRVNTFKKLYCWFIIRVLWNEFAVDGKIKNFSAT